MNTATAAPKLDIDPKAVEAIRKEHEAAVTAYWDAVGHARAAGLKLMDVKAVIDSFNKDLPRREKIKFGRWVNETCGVTRQTAWNYMTIAERWDELTRSGLAKMTMRGALRYLKDQDGQTQPDGKEKAKRKRRVRIKQAAWDGVVKRYGIESDELGKVLKALGIDPALV